MGKSKHPATAASGASKKAKAKAGGKSKAAAAPPARPVPASPDGVHKKKKAKAGTPSKLVRSTQKVVQTAAKNRVAVNRAWKLAPECATFRKVVHKPATKATADKPATKARTYERSNRVMNNHAVRTLFSAGAAQAAAKLAAEGVALRTVAPPAMHETATVEVANFPSLPSASGPIAYGLEARGAAFMASVNEMAAAIKDRLAGSAEKGAKQRVMPKHYRLALKAVSKRIAAASGLGMLSHVRAKPITKKSGGKAKAKANGKAREKAPAVERAATM